MMAFWELFQKRCTIFWFALQRGVIEFLNALPSWMRHVHLFSRVGQFKTIVIGRRAPVAPGNAETIRNFPPSRLTS